jgi:hypothetical protein
MKLRIAKWLVPEYFEKVEYMMLLVFPTSQTKEELIDAGMEISNISDLGIISQEGVNKRTSKCLMIDNVSEYIDVWEELDKINHDNH